MKETHSYYFVFGLLIFMVLFLFLVNISLGSVAIPLPEVVKSLFGGSVKESSWIYIVNEYRLPKAITAVMVGSGLSISGILMQTLFRNPLAGPYVLGISSGASLGVAILIMGSSILGGHLINASSQLSLSLAASAGSFLVLLAVILVAKKVQNTMSLLIIGLMFSSLSSAVIAILAYFSQAESLQQFMFWGFGSLGHLSWSELTVFFVVFILASLMTLPLFKPLNGMLLGEHYAQSMGINMQRTRYLLLLVTSLFTGVITAFAGPIAFIGLSAPHITKLMINSSNHRILVPCSAIVGAILVLISDTIAQLPLSEYTLPINAVTTLFGAPIVIWLLLRKRKLLV